MMILHACARVMTVRTGDDELHAAAQQAQQGGEGNGPAHPVHVCAATGHVHHRGGLLWHLDQTTEPLHVVSKPLLPNTNQHLHIHVHALVCARLL